MNNKNYDERQKFVNYRLSHHSLMIVFILLIVNALFKSTSGTTWAEPTAEMILTITIPGIYYVSRSIFSDAYVGTRDSVRKNVVTFLFLAVLFFLASNLFYADPIVEEGMLTDTATPLIAGIFFVVISVLHGIKLIKDKSQV
ncbi:MAG: hypothetical protein ACLFUQ_03590 [Candidatus Izemoplasmataceae bacterium]